MHVFCQRDSLDQSEPSGVCVCPTQSQVGLYWLSSKELGSQSTELLQSSTSLVSGGGGGNKSDRASGVKIRLPFLFGMH